MRLPSLKFIFVFIFLYCCQWATAQYTIPQKPTPLYPVYDEEGLLSQEELHQLSNKLINYADSTSTEIEVIIIPSTKGEDVNFLATMFGEKWGIGQKGIDNGVVLLIALEDRTMAIQPGRRAEQYLTASTAGQILDYIVTPQFRKGNYYEGINGGTSAIIDALQGKFKPILKNPKDNDWDGLSIALFFFALFIILILINSGNNGRGGGGRYDDDEDVIISRRGRSIFPGGFGGFGGFGGGSGGFGGFGGGGSFGGGGASGSW